MFSINNAALWACQSRAKIKDQIVRLRWQGTDEKKAVNMHEHRKHTFTLRVYENKKMIPVKVKLNLSGRNTRNNEAITYPQVVHFLWYLQNIDKQTEQTYPMSIVFLWQKHLWST